MMNKDGKPRKRKTCSNCHEPGHWAKTCTKPKAVKAAPVTWDQHVLKALGGKDETCTPSSSSQASPSGLGSFSTTQSPLPPPIDLSGAFSSGSENQPSPSEQPTPKETPLPNQPRPQEPPPPQNPPQPPPQAAETADAEAAGKLVAEYWVLALEMGNAFVEKHGGFCLGKQLIAMNREAMKYLATRLCLEYDVKPEDTAAMVVVGSGAVVGGQSAYFVYRDLKNKKEEKRAGNAVKPETRATQPSTGKPVQGAPNGVPSQGQPVAIIPIAPGRPDYTPYG